MSGSFLTSPCTWELWNSTGHIRIPSTKKAVLADERTSPALTMHALCIRYGTKAETNLKPLPIGEPFPELFSARCYEMLEPPPWDVDKR